MRTTKHLVPVRSKDGVQEQVDRLIARGIHAVLRTTPQGFRDWLRPLVEHSRYADINEECAKAGPCCISLLLVIPSAMAGLPSLMSAVRLGSQRGHSFAELAKKAEDPTPFLPYLAVDVRAAPVTAEACIEDSKETRRWPGVASEGAALALHMPAYFETWESAVLPGSKYLMPVRFRVGMITITRGTPVYSYTEFAFRRPKDATITLARRISVPMDARPARASSAQILRSARAQNT